jgi:hypothetical protein
MGLWESRAQEIQRLLDEGRDYGYIARYYNVSRSGLRAELTRLRKKGLLRGGNQSEKDPTLGYKQTLEILADGTHKSDKLLRMSAEQAKDVNYLLEAHGYDKETWELVSARNNIWNVYSKKDGVQVLYASKIVVRPKRQQWTFEQLLEAIKQVQPVYVDHDDDVDTSGYMLEIPLFDMHFGISDFEHYKETQKKIYRLIKSRKWERVLFIIGQDLFHNDNFKGTTANGTQIEAVDMPKAWADAERFYCPLIHSALTQCRDVHVVYSPGNHDQSMAWAFVKWLSAKFPQANYDDSVKQRKVHVFHRCFIGITHQDKGSKDLINIFPAEFPIEWAATVTREIHGGHWHKEDAKDSFGIMRRTLATANKTDKWHEENGFIGAHKRFQVFKWSHDALESIHYV